MVQFDTRLPMMIQQPNILAAMDAGTTNAANQAALMRQAEGQNVFRQYGAGAMRGDPAALNALAGFDPVMAQGMRLDQRQDARADASLRLAQEAGARAAREAQDRAAAMAEAQQAQGLMKQLAQAYATGNEQAFGAISAEIAGQPLPMEPQSLQTLDAFITGFSGGLSSLAPQEPSLNDRYKVVGGQLVDMMADGGPAPVAGIEGRSAGFSVTTPDGTVISQGGPIVMDRANLQAGSGQVRVEDPTSPTGTRIFAEPGSAAEAEQQASERADRAAAENQATTASVVLETTRRIRDLAKDKNAWRRLVTADLPEVGIWGERANRFGVSQEAADVGEMLGTLQGMVAFDRLEKMKAASATGASGLGQVTEREIALLSAQLGALTQRTSRELILSTMDTVERVFGKLSPEAQAYITGASDVEPWTQGGRQAPAQTMPDFLSETDRMIWEDLDETERQIIINSYGAQR